MIRRSFLAWTAVAFAATALFVGTAVADEPQPGAHEGKVVKVDGAKLTMSDKEGKNQHTHAIPATATITIDGKAAKLDELKVGAPVTITMEKKGDKVEIVKVEGKKGD